MRLIFLLIILAITFVLALANGYDVFFRLTYFLAFLVAFCYIWAKFSLSGLAVSSQGGGGRVQVGQKQEERVTVQNRGKLPKLWLEVRQNSNMPGYHPSWAVYLPEGRRQSWRVEILCHQRGHFTIGPFSAASGDPFGFFKKECVLGNSHTLLVYPATVELPHFHLPPADLPGEGRYRRRTHFITPNAAGIREYVHGDSFNRIHWPSTARTGQIMVKEFEMDPASEIWIVLDMDKGVHVGEGRESTEEYAVTIAASVAKRYLEANRSVGIITYGEEFATLKAERGGQQLARILELLAVVRARGPVPLADLLVAEGKRFGRYTTLLVITPSTQETWIYNLHHLVRRGASVSAVLLEPSTFDGSNNTIMAVGSLVASGIPTYLVKKGDPLDQALSLAGEQAARGTAS